MKLRCYLHMRLNLTIIQHDWLACKEGGRESESTSAFHSPPAAPLSKLSSNIYSMGLGRFIFILLKQLLFSIPKTTQLPPIEAGKVFVNTPVQIVIASARFISPRPRHGHPGPAPLSPPAPQHEAPRARHAPRRLWSARAPACYGAPSSARQPRWIKEQIHQ